MDNLYLVHFGVKGMKWGVRKDRDSSGNSNKGKSKKDHTKAKRALKIGAAVAGTSLAIYGAYKLGQSGVLDKYINRGKGLLNPLAGNVSNIEGFKSLKPSERTISSIVKKVNPLKGTEAGNFNCTLCSIASALRLKGLDVSALGSLETKNLGGVIESVFKTKMNTVKELGSSRVSSAKDMSNILTNRFDDGAFGAISIPMNAPSGKGSHAFNWLIEKGAAKFFDGQKELEDCSKWFDFISSDGLIQFARLDDLELNLDNVGKFVKSHR